MLSGSTLMRRPTQLGRDIPKSYSTQSLANAREDASIPDTQSENLDMYFAPSYSDYTHENYKVTRVGTRDSCNSAYSNQSVYRVSLDFSPKEIALVRYTWNRMLVDDAEPKISLPGAFARPKKMAQLSLHALSTFCTQLYLNLLSMDPELEQAFPSLRHQAVSMAGVMSLAVNSLDNLSSLDAYLEQLGKRHLRILGIEPFQFEMMGEALVQTFVQRFGSKFTQQLEVLWIKFYMYLANTLLQFGLDPVLRLEPGAPQVFPRQLRPESVFSGDTLSLLNLARRVSQSTGLTEVLSVLEKSAAPKVRAPPAQKRRLRLKKKSDCVIV